MRVFWENDNGNLAQTDKMDKTSLQLLNIMSFSNHLSQNFFVARSYFNFRHAESYVGTSKTMGVETRRFNDESR